MATGRYSNLSDDELRELAASELTDEAWAELEGEFEARSLDHPTRQERWVSEREKGTDLGSRLAKGAAYYFVLALGGALGIAIVREFTKGFASPTSASGT